MKKLLCVLLSAVLVVTLGVTALAEPVPVDTPFSTGGILGLKHYEGKPDYVICPKGADIGDHYWMEAGGGTLPAEYSATVILELVHAGEVWENFSLDMIRNMKVKAEWEEGGDLVASVAVTVVRSTSWSDMDWTSSQGYFPALVIALKDSAAIADTDLIGTVTLNKSKGKQEYRIKDAEIPIEFAIDYWYSYRKYDTLNIDTDYQFISPGEQYLLRFDYDDEVEFSFGAEPNEGTFTVDVSGQGKLLLIYDTKPNAAVEKANPDARLVFFGFNNASFNRTGEFFYEIETGKYIYELIDGMPVMIAGAEYDESDGGFRFYTRKLGRYVISDVELNMPNPKQAKAEVLSGNDLHNPTALVRFGLG